MKRAKLAQNRLTYLSRLSVQCFVYHSVGSLAKFGFHQLESVSQLFLFSFEVVIIRGLVLVLQILIYITVRNPIELVSVVVLALLGKAAVVNQMRVDCLLLGCGFVFGWFDHLRVVNYNSNSS